jgi:hypothetical protein
MDGGVARKFIDKFIPKNCIEKDGNTYKIINQQTKKHFFWNVDRPLKRYNDYINLACYSGIIGALETYEKRLQWIIEQSDAQ